MRVQEGVFVLYALNGEKNHHVNILHLYLKEDKLKRID